MARKINYIIIHCTATPEGRLVTNEEITRWHKARGQALTHDLAALVGLYVEIVS